MAVTAGLVLEGVVRLLKDQNYDTWPQSDMLYWLNDGIYRIVQLKPESNAVHQNVKLTAGVTQTIGSDSIQFIRAVRNVKGEAVNFVDYRHLNSFDPAWTMPRFGGSGEKDVKEYAFDAKSPRTYYVYPYNNGNGEIEIVTSKVPERVEDADSPLPIDDVFTPALVDYVASRCLSSQTEARSREEGDKLFSKFLVALGLDSEVDMAHDPKETEGQPT